jgi:hypothetical protein
MHTYEVRPRRDHRGVDLISDVLPFGGLCNAEPITVSNAIGYAQLSPLLWDSVRARHTAMPETAARPSQGRRSRNVRTMLALS